MVAHQAMMVDFIASSNSVKTAIREVVSSDIGDNTLIAYQDLLKFNTIDINFHYELP